MRIAVCDDERDYAESLADMVKSFKEREKAADVSCAVFTSGSELLASVQSGDRFDVYLLDILMPGINGMDLARRLREGDAAARLIFLTASPEYAVESYAVSAYYYLLKPVDRDELWRLLGRIHKSAPARPQLLTVKTQEGYKNVALKDIEYVEVINRTLRWALVGGAVLESVGHMADIESELLKHPAFIKPHRSYIVNMAHIDVLNASSLKMCSSGSVPVSRNSYKQTKSAYIGYSFREGGASPDV